MGCGQRGSADVTLGPVVQAGLTIWASPVYLMVLILNGVIAGQTKIMGCLAGWTDPHGFTLGQRESADVAARVVQVTRRTDPQILARRPVWVLECAGVVSEGLAAQVAEFHDEGSLSNLDQNNPNIVLPPGHIGCFDQPGCGLVDVPRSPQELDDHGRILNHLPKAVGA